uniref:Putative secreted protein n=1 Tax=Anopheles darlingi TaxID=43151 RepID=A0A2M4DDX5_ANODA
MIVLLLLLVPNLMIPFFRFVSSIDLYLLAACRASRSSFSTVAIFSAWYLFSSTSASMSSSGCGDPSPFPVAPCSATVSSWFRRCTLHLYASLSVTTSSFSSSNDRKSY